jgi:hypothetical protein
MFRQWVLAVNGLLGYLVVFLGRVIVSLFEVQGSLHGHGSPGGGRYLSPTSLPTLRQVPESFVLTIANSSSVSGSLCNGQLPEHSQFSARMWI